MNIKRIPLIMACLLLGLFSCQQPANKQYTLDNAYLADIVKDPRLGVSVRPPLQWEEVPLQNIEAYNKAISEVSPYGIKVSKMFLNQNTSGILLISDISGLSESMKQNLPTQYNNLLNSQNQWNEITYSKLDINELTAEEFLMQSSVMVNYKLLFWDKQTAPFQVDYLIPQSFYDDLMKQKLESSIASIRR